MTESVPRQHRIQVHFSDFFAVSPQTLEDYGAFNISLINDLPVFIDPFLIFNSSKPEYQQLHQGIIHYVRFLRDKASAGGIRSGLLDAWYGFREIKQNWLGYSLVGNSGNGLGADFAQALYRNLHTIFTNFGHEQITLGSHLEKLCLVTDGIGRDNISDFTTNLIKEFLVQYTQTFARQHLSREYRQYVVVERVRFNYGTETWESGIYELPWFGGEEDYVILTPKDMLTKDDMWISRAGLIHDFRRIATVIPNDQLRASINTYLLSALAVPQNKTETKRAIIELLVRHPEIIEYYIRAREDLGDEARSVSSEKVHEAEELFVSQVSRLVETLAAATDFYDETGDSYEEALRRVNFLKHVIENNDGYRIFYYDGQHVEREETVQVLFRLTWYASPYDVNRETNNGRGPVDFKVSRGSADKSLVEFKLASNSQLRRNLEKQVAIYQVANQTAKSIKVIFYFSAKEHARVLQILQELGLNGTPSVVLVDAAGRQQAFSIEGVKQLIRSVHVIR